MLATHRRALSLALAATLAAQQPSAAPVPDLEGGWVRLDVDGSGSFNGLAAKFPRAVLTPAGAGRGSGTSQTRGAAAFRFRSRPVEAEGRRRGLRGHRRQLHAAGRRRAELLGLPHRAEPRPGADRAREPRPAAHDLHGRPRAPGSEPLDANGRRPLDRPIRGRRAGRRDDRPRDGQRHGRRVADAGNAADRALPPVGRRPASHDHLHVAGPEGVREAAHLRDRGRAHAARQLGVRVVVRLERSQSAALDRAAAAEQVTSHETRSLHPDRGGLAAGGSCRRRGSPDISGFWELSFDSRRVPAAEPGASGHAGGARQAGRTRRARDSLVQLPRAATLRWILRGRSTSARDAARSSSTSRPWRRRGISTSVPSHANMEIFDPTTQRRLDRPLGGRHAGGGHHRLRRREGRDDDSRRRLPHVGFASGRALSPAERRHGAVGHVHLGRPEGVSHAAHLRVPLPPRAATVRGAAAAGCNPFDEARTAFLGAGK